LWLSAWAEDADMLVVLLCGYSSSNKDLPCNSTIVKNQYLWYCHIFLSIHLVSRIAVHRLQRWHWQVLYFCNWNYSYIWTNWCIVYGSLGILHLLWELNTNFHFTFPFKIILVRWFDIFRIATLNMEKKKRTSNSSGYCLHYVISSFST
jgi:hypothetical protein